MNPVYGIREAKGIKHAKEETDKQKDKKMQS